MILIKDIIIEFIRKCFLHYGERILYAEKLLVNLK